MIAAIAAAAVPLLAAPRPASLAASPARLTLSGAESRTIRVTNRGGSIALIDARPAGFALDLHGRPRIVARTDVAASRLAVQPRRLTLRPGETSTVIVSATLPRRVRPGDHPALVLLTTQTRAGAGVAVRMQVGIVVIVRAPGPVTHRLEIRGLHVRHAGKSEVLELSILNRGNVTEHLARGRVRVSLLRRGRVVASVQPAAREVLPRTAASEEFGYRRRLRGWVTAVVEISRPGGGLRTLRRSYRIRL